MTRPARCAPGDAEPAGGDADRRRRLDDVLIELGRRLDAGETIDEAAVFRTHAELMPELEENLRALRRLAELARAVGAAEAVGTAAAAPPPAPPPNPLEAALDEELHVLQQALGEYEVLERVRHGGQGVVYKARQRGTNRVVALKLLLDGPLATVEQRARFGREIELVARLRHPNIVAVHGAGVVRGRNFYAMEFIEGLPINDYVVLHDLAPAEIVALMVKVADAVHHAHQNGIIHRDLNPANILVDEAGEPRVFDFGLAKDLWADGQATLTGIGCGTLPYLSPEQAGAGDGRADVRSDVYAIGLVLYELLTDMFPYTVHGEPEAVRAAIINAEPLPLRKAIAAGGPERARGLQNINADLEHVLSRALAKAKDERYQTAAALADELRRWLAGEAVEARAASNWYLLRKTVRRHRVAVSIVGVVMLALAATTGTVLYSSVQIRAERDNAARLSGILVNELEDSFRRLPGGVEARNRLLGKLIERYPEVERLAARSRELAPALAMLMEKQGDLAAEEGRPREAGAWFERFLAAARRLAELPGAGLEEQATVIRAHRKLAETDDDDRVLARYDVGQAYAESLALPPGSDDSAHYEHCALLRSRADWLQQEDWHRDAVAWYERAAGLLPQAANPPASERWRTLKADILGASGRSWAKVGDAVRCEERLRAALRLRRELAGQTAASVQARLALYESAKDLAFFLFEACRNTDTPEDECRTLLDEATAGFDLLASMDPTALGRGRAGWNAHVALSALYLDENAYDAADREKLITLQIASQLAQADQRREARRRLARSLFGKSQTEIKLDRADEALAHLQEALAIAEFVYASAPDNPRSLDTLVIVHDALGSAARAMGDLEALYRHREQADRLSWQAYCQDPNSADRVLSALVGLGNLARAALETGQPERLARASGLLDGAESLLNELTRTGARQAWEVSCYQTERAIRRNRRDLQAALSPQTASAPASAPASVR